MNDAQMKLNKQRKGSDAFSNLCTLYLQLAWTDKSEQTHLGAVVNNNFVYNFNFEFLSVSKGLNILS